MRATHLALLFGWALACGEVDDPTLRERFDPGAVEPPPPITLRPPLATRQVFWGDLHIHTAYSYDAYTFGVRALPDDAYTHAKGGTIEHGVGYPIRASRPLDFAAVTDHAEYLGVPRHLGASDPDPGPSLRDVLETGSPWRITANFIWKTLVELPSRDSREEAYGGDYGPVSRDAWRDVVAAAARHDDPGRFTTFIGYEWTSMPDGQNLHRNVIYRSDRVPDFPFSSRDSGDPEELWRALDAERARGMEMIAIPHNGNVSNGLMYDRVTLGGAPLDASYAETRMRNEPLTEILQVKGSSETHPLLSGEDEFADFEIYDQLLRPSGSDGTPRGSYARDAFRTGLELSAERGFNPYRFGVIGSSDSHNASSTVEEDRHHGKLPLIDGTAGLRLGESLLLPASQNRGLQWSAQGLAAVWAEENTRASLFDAMRRRETYATSGPRITVRLFAGWNFEPSILDAPDLAARGYAGGVPMGGRLAGGTAGRAPRLVAVALRDPVGAHLDRIQIIKGWVDAEGKSHEHIYDVAASDGRTPDPDTDRVPPVGSTVDVARATYANTIGARRLAAVFTDPDFDPAREAFYYARVLEIPTPRWSTYDAAALGIEAPEPTAIQERAITSPVWYSPD